MNYTTTMTSTFETEKNKKALVYTSIILGGILLIILLVSWKLPQHPTVLFNDLIEINLGNDEEGYGEVQPLIKGEKSPSSESAPQQQAAAPNQPAEEIKTDDASDHESAPVTKPVKTTPKVVPIPVLTAPPAPKPQKPKIAGYDGPKGGTGNGATEDNGYKYQGNKPGGTGDAGSPSGKPDSYGNSPGGRTGGGANVTKGDRFIVNNYFFMGDLPKATIFAKIKVSSSGRGTFIGFDKGSTSIDSRYANAIRNNYLPNMVFNKDDKESEVTLRFNFRVQ